MNSEMQETCSNCDGLRKANHLLSSKKQIYERQIESLGKTNAESGNFLQESEQQIAKLNQAVALLTRQIAEKITENTMLRLEVDMNKGGKVKENNNLPDIDKFLEVKMHIPSEDNLRKKETNKESYSEMENSENSDDVQEFEDEETEATMDKEQLQTCAWIVSDGKGTSGVCGRAFPAAEDLVDHFKKDHMSTDRNGNYICSWDRCQRNDEPFQSKAAIISHFRCHCGEKSFRCPFEGCDQTFADLGTLRVHRDSHSRKKYPCLDPECPKVFSHKSYMMAHYRVRHTGERKGFVCQVEDCGKVFETDQGIRKHYGSHRAERPYQCKFPRCYQSFASEQSLDEHSETHGSEAGRECPYDGCGRKFPYARDVREHVRADHTGEKPLVCPYGCGMSFSKKWFLNRHLKVHAKMDDTAEPPETDIIGTC